MTVFAARLVRHDLQLTGYQNIEVASTLFVCLKRFAMLVPSLSLPFACKKAIIHRTLSRPSVAVRDCHIKGALRADRDGGKRLRSLHNALCEEKVADQHDRFPDEARRSACQQITRSLYNNMAVVLFQVYKRLPGFAGVLRRWKLGGRGRRVWQLAVVSNRD